MYYQYVGKFFKSLFVYLLIILRNQFYVTDDVTVVCKHEDHWRRPDFDEKYAWTEVSILQTLLLLKWLKFSMPLTN